jgi:hypothetical protein
MSNGVVTQNNVMKRCLMEFYSKEDNLQKMLRIINGETNISLRIVDWFVTNYAKEYWTTYDVELSDGTTRHFKVFKEYKQMLNSYSKMRFDPFCRWNREYIPYGNCKIQTTIGQMNFFKWAIQNNIVEYIEENFDKIKSDMNIRNSTSKRKQSSSDPANKTRKKRQELSICASKSIKRENVKISVKFD